MFIGGPYSFGRQLYFPFAIVELPFSICLLMGIISYGFLKMANGKWPTAPEFFIPSGA
jgi:hypothetical protein